MNEMNEFKENEIDEDDDAKLKKAIHALGNKESIRRIAKIAEENNYILSICQPSDERKNDEIYFCVELKDQSKPALGTSVLGGRLVEITEYFENIFINLRGNGGYTDVTTFTPENYDNIQRFFQKHYLDFYPAQSSDASNQAKKQRSDSSRFFPKNDGQQKDEVKLPTSEEIVRHLQNAPWWELLKRCSPEKAGDVLDQACGRAKRTLSQEQTSSSRPTGAAK